MPWNGGVFTRTNGEYNGTTVWQTDALNDIKIESDRHDVHDQDLADGINACLPRDGTAAMTGFLDMGGNVIVNASQIDNGSFGYVTIDNIINSLMLSGNKLLTGMVPGSLPDITVDLTPVMDGAGTNITFDTGTNILSMTRQGIAAADVNLSTLAGSIVGWGAPETVSFTASPGTEKLCLGAITATIAAGFSAGDVVTFHNYAATGVTTIDLTTNSYFLAYGGDVFNDDLTLDPGDTVTLVAIDGSTLEII